MKQELREYVRRAYGNGCGKHRVDIGEHMDILRLLAADCDIVTEFGVRTGNSTLALCLAHPSRITSYDVDFSDLKRGETEFLKRTAGEKTGLRFVKENTLECEIAETDMLFVDTLHTYHQVWNELKRHADKVRKYIVLHDTVLYGVVGEDGSFPGIVAAIYKFLDINGDWRMGMNLLNQNGLIVLERI